MPTWVSLAKRNGSPRIFLVDAEVSGDGVKLIAGLAFVQAHSKSRRLTLRCMDDKSRIRVEFPDELLGEPLPRCYHELDLEVISDE